MRSAAKDFRQHPLPDSEALALQVGHARFQRLMESNMVGVAVADAAGGIYEANDYYLNLIGYTRAEFAAGNVRWTDVTPPEHLPSDENALAELRQHGVCTPYEKEYLRRDGTLVPVLIYVATLPGPRDQVLAFVQDLTERKRAEEALRQSEERFRHIFRDGPLGMAVFDPDNRFIEVNRAFCKMLGMSDRELMSRTVADVTHPEDLDADLPLVRRVLAGELSSYSIEKRFVRKDGEARWARITTSFLRPSASGRACGLKMVEDITLRKQAEERLRRSESQLAEAQHLAHMGSWHWDLATGAVTWSDEQYRIYGLEPGTVSPNFQLFLDLVHADDRERIRGLVDQSYREGGPLDHEFRTIRSDGQVRVLHSRGDAVVNAAGRVVAMYGTSQDVTERVKAEEAMRISERRYRSVVAAATDLVWVADGQGKMTVDVPGWREITGQTEAESLGWGWVDAVHPDDRDNLVKVWTHSLATQNPHEQEFRLRAKDGSYRHVICRAVPVFDQGGTVIEWVGTITDVTDRKRAEAAERERNDLRNAVRALDRVLGVVGHELRTPLAATRAMTELLLMQDISQGEDAKRLLQSAHDEIVKMGAMVNDLLEVARLNSGTAKWSWTSVPVARACSGAIESVRPLINAAEVQLSVKADPQDLCMTGDAEAVRRLVLNLLTNAHKNTRSGSIRVTAERHRERDEEYVRIEVADTGDGISREVTAKLGDAFVLNSGIIGDDYVKGSGLGLAICRGIVAAHGGRMSVASAPGRGTTVTVLLRADLSAPASDGREVRITVESAAT
jgi:PAS domain S-box-containing protein